MRRHARRYPNCAKTITALLVSLVSMNAAAQFEALERVVMPGPVISGHAEYEADCESCHARFSRGRQTALCLECHVEIADDLATDTGFHSLSPEVDPEASCATCHTDHAGRDADIVGLDTETFDHALTDFPLRDTHLEPLCEDCHAAEQPFHDVLGTQCYDCHVEDDQHLGSLGTECADCHRETQWSEAFYDHEIESGYALTGAHTDLTCVSCHVEEIYADTPTQCYGCHREDDTHMGRNGTECQDCHQTTDWADNLFDHLDRTGFALSGGHSGIECDDCHTGNRLEVALATDCYSCHETDDAHDGINGTVCSDCHQVTQWLDVRFDHAVDADFPLNGAHAQVECADCHVEPVAVALPATDCYDCHIDEEPHEQQLGEDCAGCHTEIDWTSDVRFDHDFTVFPLVGRHDEIVCEDCHETPAFHDAPEQCIDCHAEDDAHEARLGPECADCHAPIDWMAWTFDHNTRTQFALEGAHDGLQCEACHITPVTDGSIAVSQTCVSCHRSDDVHRGEFGNDCAECHTSESFADLRAVR